MWMGNPAAGVAARHIIRRWSGSRCIGIYFICGRASRVRPRGPRPLNGLTLADLWTMDITSFLRRIDYTGSTTPGEATLRALHRAFVTTVPFENLDIHLGRRIVLDEDAFFEKI